MISDPITALALILGLGVGAQWLGTRLRIPSIVLMLGAGLAVGPGLGWLDPDDTYGSLLTPVISLGVGLLLFEGGLSLRWSAIGSTTRRVVVRLLSLGMVVSFVLASTAAILLTDMPRGVAVLFGAIMVVTGPTVVIPLLRQARLRPRVGGILRWEGIIIDPIGAVLGVTVLEVLLVEEGTPAEVAWALARTTVAGCLVGLAVAVALMVVLDRHWVPDHLRGPLSMVAAIAAFAIANEIGSEAGLYATTVAGVLLANQRRVAVSPIMELHDHLASLILAGLFVVLAARVEAETLSDNLLPALALLAVLVLVVRPAAVAAATAGTTLTTRERTYLAALAPRGIVAASVSAVFGFELTDHGLAGGEDLAATTFLVVAGTTLVYGPLARPLARRLRVDTPDPTGVALLGARRWARALGRALTDLGVQVLVLAEDEQSAEAARGEGLLVYSGRLESDDLAGALEGVGARLAVVGSGAESLEAFGVDRVVRSLGRANVWRVARDDEQQEALGDEAFEGRHAFGEVTQADLDDALANGGSVVALAPGAHPGDLQMPLMVVTARGVPRVVGTDARPRPDERLVVLSVG